VRKGEYEGTTRKNWLEITEEEKEKYKSLLVEAL
jgi:hypothetical protein